MTDSDSLVYISDKEFSFGEDIPQSVKDDINHKEMMVFGGYYHFESGWGSPKIYLLCRGLRSGKFKLKVEGFLPY
ncbi:MAG: hypothetical protein KJ556_21225 [Gammaproteobacteria bacterium]|nr:hypothetical protein [Gammaproteobacteria bacterium]